MKDKRVVFMGTPDFAVPVLKTLIENLNVVLVVTQPDKKVGREGLVSFSPIKKVALENNIEVFQPTKIRNDYERVIEVKPDIIITCAYGQIIPDILLETPKYKAINVHASLLPKLRGGAPLHKSIIYGYKETGITIMYMSHDMDAGDIISQESIEILDSYNVGDVHDLLSEIAPKLLMKTLPSIFEGTNTRYKQNEDEVTYAYNVTREEEHIDFCKPARDVFNQIRGLYPFPISYMVLDGKIIKVISSFIGENTKEECATITNVSKEGISISCMDKEIVITKLKPEGKKEMNAVDFINGYKEELKGKKVM